MTKAFDKIKASLDDIKAGRFTVHQPMTTIPDDIQKDADRIAHAVSAQVYGSHSIIARALLAERERSAAEITALKAWGRMPDAQRRQWWLSNLIATRGYFNRSDLTAEFVISIPQASKDIQVWLKANPNTAVYNDSAKRYDRARAALEGK